MALETARSEWRSMVLKAVKSKSSNRLAAPFQKRHLGGNVMRRRATAKTVGRFGQSVGLKDVER